MVDVRTLLLLRHAKSSWADPLASDHDRPLAPRGERAAQRIAEHVRTAGIRPELVLCSSARRTRDTLDLLRPVLEASSEIRIEDDLYGADAREMLDRLRIVDAAVSSAMIIGHNPALQELALALAGDGVESAARQLRAKFPTCALVTLDVSGCDWAGLREGQGYLTSLVLPRHLP